MESVKNRINCLILAIVFVWSAVIAPTVTMAQSVREADEADRMTRAAMRVASRGAGLVWKGIWQGKKIGWDVVCRDPRHIDQVRLMRVKLAFLANKKSSLVVRNGRPAYDNNGFVQVGDPNNNCLLPYKTGTVDLKTGLEIHGIEFSTNPKASDFLAAYARDDEVIKVDLRKVKAQTSANTKNIARHEAKINEIADKVGVPRLDAPAVVKPDNTGDVEIVVPAPKPSPTVEPSPKPTVVAPEAAPSSQPKPSPTVKASPKPAAPKTPKASAHKPPVKPAVKKAPKAVKPKVSATKTPPKVAVVSTPSGLGKLEILSPAHGEVMAKDYHLTKEKVIKGVVADRKAAWMQILLDGKPLGTVRVIGLGRWSMQWDFTREKLGNHQLMVRALDSLRRPIGMPRIAQINIIDKKKEWKR